MRASAHLSKQIDPTGNPVRLFSTVFEIHQSTLVLPAEGGDPITGSKSRNCEVSEIIRHWRRWALGGAYNPPDVGYAETSSATEHFDIVNKKHFTYCPRRFDLQQYTYNRHRRSTSTKQRQQSLQHRAGRRKWS